MKKSLCITLIFLLSIQCFASIVSDNDGSAFVTKAEFESLKDNFSDQIVNYNDSIDKKIDGAIASYLSGIKIDKIPTNLIENYEMTTGKKLVFMYELPGIGVSNISNDLLQTVDCELAIKRVNNLSIKQNKWEGTKGEVTRIWTAVVFPSSYWQNNNGWNDYYACERKFNSVGLTEWPSGNITSETAEREVSLATYGTFPQKTTVLSHPLVGAGSGWLWQNFGNNKYNLKYYCVDLYPSYNVVWNIHYYKYFPATTYTYYLNSTGLTINDLSLPTNPVLESIWGASNSAGSKASSSTDTNLHNYIEMSSSLVKTDDGTNYLDVVWGLDATTTIYGNDEDFVPELSSTNVTLEVDENVKYQNQAYQFDGFKTFETSYPNTTQRVKLRDFTMQNKPLSYFCNNTLSNIASEIVYNGNGAPCYYCSDTDIVSRGKIKLTTTSGTCTCNVKISDKPFNNGEIATNGHEILNINLATGVEQTFNLNNLDKGNYYIFIKNNTNNNPITIDLFDII